jgi:hypothetical protein
MSVFHEAHEKLAINCNGIISEDTDIVKLSLDEKQKQISNEKNNNWNRQWELASNTINHSNAKIIISVVSPEVISSMMSKSVDITLLPIY